jgi:hypothetical protein
VRAEGDRSRLRAGAPVLAAAIGVATVLVVVNQVSRIARASQAVHPVAAATHSDVPAATSQLTEPSSTSSDGVLGFTPPPEIASPEPVSSAPSPTVSPSATAKVSATPKPTTKPTAKPSSSPSASTSTPGTVTSVSPAQASVVVVNGTDYAIHVVLDGAAVTVPARGFGQPLLVNSAGPDTLQVNSEAHPTCGVNQRGDFHLVAPHRYQLQIANGPGCVVGGADVGSPTAAGFTQTDG